MSTSQWRRQDLNLRNLPVMSGALYQLSYVALSWLGRA